MKTTGILLFFVLIGIKIHAQTNVGVLVRQRPNPPTTGDTINAGQGVCLDTTVITFVVTVVYKGGIYEKRCTGNCSGSLHGTSSGSKIFCSEIITEPQKGVRVRLPARTFYVR